MNSYVVLFLFSFIRLCVTEKYVLDDRLGLGRQFDGIGGLSGGGVGYLCTSTCFLIYLLLSAWFNISGSEDENILIFNILLLGYFETSDQL